MIDWNTLSALREANKDRGKLDTELALGVEKWKLKERLIQEGVQGAEAEMLVQDMSGDEVTEFKNDLAAMEAGGDPEAPENYCPGLGECPPAAVSIYCQPHPESFTEGSPYEGRTILKFSSIPESTIKLAGITPESIEALLFSMGVNVGITAGQLQQLSLLSADQIRTWVDNVTPRIPDGAIPFLSDDAKNAANQRVEQALQELEDGLVEAFLTTMCAVKFDKIAVPVGVQPATHYAGIIYEFIRETAYAGIECPELTIRLEGSFSYTGVASFASITGGVVLSSNGNGGIVGSVNVFGVPVGQARCFIAQTDKFGNPTMPAICGEIVGKIGPLEFGSVAGLLDCPECTTKLFNTFTTLAGSLQSEYTYQIMRRLDLGADNDLVLPGGTTSDYFSLLNTKDEQMAFMSAMVQFPPVTAVGNYADEFIDFLSALADTVVPRIGMCGSMEPKLFGFSLSGGNSQAQFKMYAGLKDPQSPEYLELVQYGFSPMQMMALSAASLTGGAATIVAGLIPAPDQAIATTLVTIPSMGQLTRDALTRPPQQWAAQRLEETLKNSLTTFEYRFAPFGLETTRAGGRILFPSFEHHPQGPSAKSIPTSWPTPAKVLTAALGDIFAENPNNRLSDPFWTGEAKDFAEIFAGGDYANLTWPNDISLVDHYFPRGGVLGAGRLNLPVLLSESINDSLAPLSPLITGKVVQNGVERNASVSDKFVAAQTFITDKFLRTNPSGALAFYIPAPTVPGGGDFPQDFSSFADAVLSFDLDTVLANASQQGREEILTQFDSAFMEGWLDADILGIPIVDATVKLDIDASRTEMPVCFMVNARLDPEGWLGAYFPRQMAQHENGAEQPAFIDFDVLIDPHPAVAESRILRMREDIRRTIQEKTLRGQNVTGVQGSAVATVANALSALSIDDLRTEIAASFPRVYGKIEGHDITVPFPNAPGSEMFTIEEAIVEAYSPFYDLEGANRDTPWGRIQKEGGIGMRGNFDVLGGLVHVDNAEIVFHPDDAFAPSIHGQFTSMSGTLGGLATADALSVTFDSNSSGTNLSVDGALPSLNLGPLAQIYTRDENNRPTSIPVSLDLAADNGSWQQAGINVGPAIMESPLFAAGTRDIVHKAGNTSQPFNFNLTGAWSAAVTIAGEQKLQLKVGNDVIAELRDFGDAYPTRRGKEADYLEGKHV